MAVESEVQLEDDNDENRVENDVISNIPGSDTGLAVIETIEDDNDENRVVNDEISNIPGNDTGLAVIETIEDDNDENRVENDVISDIPGNETGLTVIETIEDDNVENRAVNDVISYIPGNDTSLAVIETIEDDNDENRVENGVVSDIPGNDTGLTVIETIEDESEDEDVDFNPFLKGSPSEEASSSLSSEVEVLETEVVDSCNVDLGLINESDDKFNEDVGVGVGVGVEVGVSCEREVENETVQGIDNGATSGIDAVEDVFEGTVIVSDVMGKDTVEFDDEDAICRRTRARYSLASFTLDELETFLQETDDDDDLQNVDEEEEYKKFLAAVLKGGDGDGQGYVEGNGDDDDDDDEDNDADFEIEIQEALESDVDDCVITSQNDEERLISSRRPKTRQNRRQKNPSSNKKNGGKQEERPLRPLIPIVFSAAEASAPCLGSTFAAGSSRTQSLPLTGFAAPQIGQLYSLIYEHVQLLVQLYSLCVLDPSRRNIAAQVKGLLSELLHKRDLVLSWKTAPYPTSCFAPPHIDPSSVRTRNRMPYLSEASDCSDGQGCRWLPTVGDSVHSVLDVEPLKLVEKYMEDVSNAVREHQKRCLETTNFVEEKQPLFPHRICPSLEINCNSPDDETADACAVSPNDKVPKKTLAATLIENAKKQSVAFVPRQIAKITEPFYPLFNSALFPCKPPPLSIANRVHFTDSEDVLLAMGMMEYNHDWKAIQQRFLPSKSEHQIFVRAKNRSSSKAPDNPIKNVRKWKTSPLTETEKARIAEALQMYRNDWTLTWRAVVPYRDPNLIRRQWRVAIGTQKSYKLPSSKKEEHRKYESTRRTKVAAMGNSINESEVNQPECCGIRNINEENDGENVNEAYVHEAFLADWTPNAAGDSASSRSYAVNEVTDHYGNKGSQIMRDRVQEVSCGSEDSRHMNHKSFHPYMNSKFPSKVSPSKALGREYFLHSQRSQNPVISNLVKLAPELPPVKLPPAVRVISQASLRNSQLVRSTEAAGAGYGLANSVPAVNCAANLTKHVHDKTRVLNSISPPASTHNSESLNNRSLTEDREDNPQMHPLLFRSLEEGHVLSQPVNNSSIIPTFSFFPALQHQMGGDLLQIPHLLGTAAGSKSSSSKEIAPASSSLDFHPFLRRTSDFNAKSFGANLTSSPLTTDLELSRDGYAEELLYRAGTDAAQLVAAASKPPSPNTNANALDLGIHLNSSRKRKFSSDESAETAPMAPSVAVRNVVEDAERTANLSDFVAAADVRKSGKDDNPAPQIVELGDSSSPHVNDSVRCQPLGEIVMEQEELSDSDEETEDVEFECEEMTDSDKEEVSVANQIVNTKHKGKEKTTQTTDINAQRSKSGTCDISEGSVAHTKGKARRADLARLGKSSTKGSWLTLNSHVSHNTEQAGANDTGSSVGVKPVRTHTRPPPRKPTSSRKKSVGERKTGLSGIDPLSISSRRHIKQAIKTPSTSSPDVDVGNSSCAQKDGEV